MSNNRDPEMQEAFENARANFRYFWREVIRDRRRIIPALGVSAIKAPFSDSKTEAHSANNPDAEHMWLSDVDFDGQFVTGVLLNTPNWLKTVKEGDSVRIPLAEISDWMYAIGNEVYGAYTVNLLRSRMSQQERKQHDSEWGLNFGDPADIRATDNNQDALLNVNLASSLKDQLAKDSSLVHAKDDKGWTLLHQEASAGSPATVKILLDAGADPDVETACGMTPLQLAKSLGWHQVVAILARN